MKTFEIKIFKQKNAIFVLIIIVSVFLFLAGLIYKLTESRSILFVLIFVTVLSPIVFKNQFRKPFINNVKAIVNNEYFSFEHQNLTIWICYFDNIISYKMEDAVYENSVHLYLNLNGYQNIHFVIQDQRLSDDTSFTFLLQKKIENYNLVNSSNRFITRKPNLLETKFSLVILTMFWILWFFSIFLIIKSHNKKAIIGSVAGLILLIQFTLIRNKYLKQKK